jgi:salicylate hydroxylase
VSFADGTAVEADVVLGADGIRSTVREHLLADRPRFSGHAIFRGLVPAAAVEHEDKVLIRMGPGQHCVSYPIAAGRLVSFAASSPAAESHGESWTSRASTGEVLAAYQGWHPEVLRLLSATDEVSVYLLHDREAVPSWGTGRVMLIGDAAHPMLPFGAQGASQGIEDALAVAAALAGATPATAPSALRRYEAVRSATCTRSSRPTSATTTSTTTRPRAATSTWPPTSACGSGSGCSPTTPRPRSATGRPPEGRPRPTGRVTTRPPPGARPAGPSPCRARWRGRPG